MRCSDEVRGPYQLTDSGYTQMKTTIQRRALAGAILGVITMAMTAHAEVKVEKISYQNLANCYRLSNGTVEVVVTTDVGPRVLRYGFAGGENLLGSAPDAGSTSALGTWKLLGGHRLWHAPETVPRTYAPDNDPVEFKIEGNSIRLTQKVEPGTGIQKELVVTLSADGTQVELLHRLTNRNLWPVDLAPWGLTVMNEGGETIIPQEPYVEHSNDTLLPVRTLVLWSYSDLSDSRVTVSRKFLRVRTDTSKKVAIKFGVSNTLGWAAYARKGELFIKRFPYDPKAEYPDRGCNNETYTEGGFMELETMAPMGTLAPGATAEHVERWYLFKGVDVGTTDAATESAIAPHLAQTKGF